VDITFLVLMPVVLVGMCIGTVVGAFIQTVMERRGIWPYTKGWNK
jgi:hypothetical protein